MDPEPRLADLLTSLARTLLTDAPIAELLHDLVVRIPQVLPVTAAGLTVVHDEREAHEIVGSDAAALSCERAQADARSGPGVEATRRGEAVHVPDLAGDPRTASLSPVLRGAGFAAAFAFPLGKGPHRTVGSLTLYRDRPGPLPHGAGEATAALADVAAAYILNARTMQDLRTTADRFRQRSLHDPLTGLANRSLFRERLDHAIDRARRSRRPLAILFADLDRFKAVNDRYGHQIGDELLSAVARRLVPLLRPSDTLARLAGDEFAILCEDLTDPADVLPLAHRIDDALRHTFFLSGAHVRISASVGIAFSGRGEEVPERLLREADAAMYRAKRDGGGQHRIIDLRDPEVP